MEIRNKSSIGLDIGARSGREGCEGIPEEMNQGEDGAAGRRNSHEKQLRLILEQAQGL